MSDSVKEKEQVRYYAEKYEILTEIPAEDCGDSVEDYRRVRSEEYFWAGASTAGAILFGYWAFEGLRDTQNGFGTFLSLYVALHCGSLVEKCIVQGRKMSQKVSELEEKVGKIDILQ